MADALTVPLVLLAAAVTLPASPRAVVAGDPDRDGTTELAVLLVWDEWGSQMRSVSTSPGAAEVEVQPAIEERRELRVFELRGDELALAAEPLPVGTEVLAIESTAPLGPIAVLTDDGPALLEVVPGEGARRDASLRLLARVRPVMAGARTFFAGLPFAHGRGLAGRRELFVPVREGTAVVAEDGTVTRLASPISEVRSGSAPLLYATFPSLLDLEGDGTRDLLDVSRSSPSGRAPSVAYRRGLGGGRVAPARFWDLAGVLERTAEEREASRTRWLSDVLDIDGDATLEALVRVAGGGASTLRGALREIRGEPGRLLVHALPEGGPVADEPERIVDLTGHIFPLPRAEGGRSSFRDLDGDGRAELVTFTVKVGYFGAARALVSGRARATIHPVVRSGLPAGLEPVSGSVPPLPFRQDLRNFDLSRFFDWPADLDGDGLVDLVEVSGNVVRLRLARRGPRYPEEPTQEIRLSGDVTSWLGVRFLDVDGDGDRDLVAFEPEARDEDAVSRATRMEVVVVDYDR